VKIYEKPELIKIKLVAGETVLAFCKADWPPPGDPGSCFDATGQPLLEIYGATTG
jgi:hypothetical protein